MVLWPRCESLRQGEGVDPIHWSDWSIAFGRRFDVLLSLVFRSFCFCDDLILTSGEKGLYTDRLIESLNPREGCIRQHAVPICRWLHHKAVGHWLRQFEVHSAWLHLLLVALQILELSCRSLIPHRQRAERNKLEPLLHECFLTFLSCFFVFASR